MKLLFKAVLAIVFLGGLAWYSSAKSNTVTIPRAEYEQLKADARYMREMRSRHLEYPSLFTGEGCPIAVQ